MNSFTVMVTLIAVAILGLVNSILLIKSFRITRTGLDKLILILACVFALVVCYFLGRAGFVSDERMISGSNVAPFYGTEWYFLLGIGIIALSYQIYLRHKSFPKKTS